MIFFIQKSRSPRTPWYRRFQPRVEVAVYRDRMTVLNPDGSTGAEYRPEQEYSTPRLLIGSMTHAAACLCRALMVPGKRIQWRPVVTLHDKVFLDEEISETEYRALEEVGYKAGASLVTLRDRLGREVKRTYGQEDH